MSRILFINGVCYGSTGTICKDLYKMAVDKGHECCIAYGREDCPEEFKSYKIGNKFDVFNHLLFTRIFDNSGFNSKCATIKFLKFVDEYKPDIIHLHNIHGYYVNIDLLFKYLKKHDEIKVIWTLHDCWSFTGHCAYFTYNKCDKWKNGCGNCEHMEMYPKSRIFNRSSKNYIQKKKIFCGVKDMTIVTPSVWLKDLVTESFLKDYRCIVVNNGINIDVFKNDKVNKKQDDKLNILGVAQVWEDRKGLSSFVELSDKLDKNKYRIILVGINSEQANNYKDRFTCIERTKNIDELAKLYNDSDVFFNPTKEDNYPTVNLEAQACGLPVITFDSGGSKETLYGNYCYAVKTVDEFIDIINKIDYKNIDFKVDMKKLDKIEKFKEYLELYK